MKDFIEHRIARESLLSMLGSILGNLERIKKDQEDTLNTYKNKILNNKFILVSDRVFRDKKTPIVMSNEIFNKIVQHSGQDSYIIDHINEFYRTSREIKIKYEYYQALINTTYHVTFNEFQYYSRVATETLNYDILVFNKLLENRFSNKLINMKDYVEHSCY